MWLLVNACNVETRVNPSKQRNKRMVLMLMENDLFVVMQDGIFCAQKSRADVIGGRFCLERAMDTQH